MCRYYEKGACHMDEYDVTNQENIDEVMTDQMPPEQPQEEARQPEYQEAEQSQAPAQEHLDESNPFDIPLQEDSSTEIQQEQTVEPQPDIPPAPPVEPKQSEAELREEADRIFKTEEQKLKEDMEAAALEMDRQARQEKLDKMAEDAQHRQNILMKIVRAIVHAIRYAVDPSYRHDCQIASSLERRADLNAQVKAYESRKADKIKDELEKIDKAQEKQEEIQKDNSLEKEAEKEKDQKGEQEKTVSPLQTAKDLVNNILEQNPIDGSVAAEFFNQDRYGLLNLAKDEIKETLNNSGYEQLSKDLINALQNYHNVLAMHEDATYARVGVIQCVAAIAEQRIQEIQQSYNADRQRALCLYMSENARHILAVPTADITQEVAKTAYDKLTEGARSMHEKSNPEKPFDAIKSYKRVLRTYPPLVKAFDTETQRKQFVVEAAITAPEALTYMDPAAINKNTIKYIEKRIAQKNEHAKEKGDQIIDIRNVADEVRAWTANGGAAAVLSEMLDEKFGIQKAEPEQVQNAIEQDNNIPVMPEYNQQSEYIQQETNQVYIDPGMTGNLQEQAVVQQPDMSEGMFFDMREDPEEQQMYQEQYEEPTEPELSWQQQPEFADAITKAQQNLSQYQMFGGPNQEELKLEVLRENPSLYQYLPDNEKTISATVEAVSRDLSLIKYVPEEDKLPEYEDRDELKEKILAQAEQHVKEEATRTKENAHSIVGSSYAKVAGSDTKEAKEMKKQLKSRSFKIQEEISKNSQDIDEH